MTHRASTPVVCILLFVLVLDYGGGFFRSSWLSTNRAYIAEPLSKFLSCSSVKRPDTTLAPLGILSCFKANSFAEHSSPNDFAKPRSTTDPSLA